MKTEQATDPIASLRPLFAVTETETHWILKCDRCKGKWQLQKSDNVHGGNILALLNHAAKHRGKLK